MTEGARMIEPLQKWLSKYWSIGVDQIESVMRESNVLGFLILWGVFEQKVFSGSLKRAEVARKASELCDVHSFVSLTEHFLYFHERYQDAENLRHLYHHKNDTDKCVKRVLMSAPDNTNESDRLCFLIHVVRRYRNNIFHGNKGFHSWLRYTEQIERCVRIMTKILDAYEESQAA